MASNSERSLPVEGVETAAGLDVAETDDYLYSLFVPCFHSATKYFDGAESFSPHRLLWIQALIQASTLWLTSGQTPATSALGLRTIDTSSPDSSSSRPGRAKGVKWIVLSVLLPTVYRQLRLWYESSSTNSNDYNHDSVTRLARERQRMVVGKILETIDRTVPALRLYALLAWWMGKRGAAPTLAMTLAGLSFTSTRPPQRLHVNFAHRRWLYEEIMRTFRLLAPYSSWNDFSSFYTGLLRPIKDSVDRIRQSRQANKENRCPLCRSEEITIPYITNCGHVYCYSCLWKATSNTDRYSCRVCRCVVSNSQPYCASTG